MSIKRGDTLANGAVVMDFSPSLNPATGKVLALAGDLSPFDPYVIWTYDTDEQGKVHCFMGKYFNDFVHAMSYWMENHAPKPCLDCDMVDGEHHYDCQTNWV
jgi:hypothetical protein